LLADLAGLPPARLIVGRLDPLLDDSAAPVTSSAHRTFKYTVA
jgi:acetyl esterase/lipase